MRLWQDSTKWWITLILVFALLTRMFRLSEPPIYIFDEVYHAITAKLIARNDVRAFEWWNPPVEPNTAVDWLHPPLAKYTQAIGMRVFGENSFGWRVSSALFGVLVIWLVMALTWEVFQRRELSLLAGFLASLDGLLLVQSRIAMNDIHVTAMILLTLWCYTRYRATNQSRRYFVWTGLAAGLAMGSKWSGVFTLPIIWGCELAAWVLPQVEAVLNRRAIQRLATREVLSRAAKYLLIWLVLPATIYVLSYTDMFIQGKSLICDKDQVTPNQCYCSQESSWWVNGASWFMPSARPALEAMEARGGCKRLISHFSELHHQIWWYQTNLKATHPHQSRPLQWFLDLRPVWIHVAYNEGTIANIYNIGNPMIFWFGGIAAIMTFMQLVLSWKAISEKRLGVSGLFFIFAAYVWVWVPWVFSPRIMFFYHYTPAVPLMCIMLAYWLFEMRQWRWGRIITIVVVMLALTTFIVWYPHWTALPVPVEWADKVYFAIKTWK